jgi:chorismate synthase
MASNSFGTVFKITTWGESHGKAIGVVVDGCPAGLPLHESIINEELIWRAPGIKNFTSPRKELDQAEILSGVFEGKTTGAPISIIIWNRDAQSQHYESLRHVLRPGHANYTYHMKYGSFDYRGGGRASARETACRVAAGIFVVAYLRSVGTVETSAVLSDKGMAGGDLQKKVRESPLFCPDVYVTKKMQVALAEAAQQKDSLGGIVEAVAFNVPVGWGDPVYEKLEANLARAMLSIPASKGFEIGEGFNATRIMGSQHNDRFHAVDEKVGLSSNHAGGVLGGISNGMPIVIRVPFKPTSSIGISQSSVDFQGQSHTFSLPEGSRHDPCVAIRAVPVVEAMLALVLADAMLLDRSARIRG